jgi:hypothetical protein
MKLSHHIYSRQHIALSVKKKKALILSASCENKKGI